MVEEVVDVLEVVVQGSSVAWRKLSKPEDKIIPDTGVIINREAGVAAVVHGGQLEFLIWIRKKKNQLGVDEGRGNEGLGWDGYDDDGELAASVEVVDMTL